MRFKHLLLSQVLLLSIASHAQHSHQLPKDAKKEFFYVTMDAKNAEDLKKVHQEDVKIIAINKNEAAAYISNHAAIDLHQYILLHGPGYIQHFSEEEAIKSIHRNSQKNSHVLDFSITENDLVNQYIDQVKAENIEETILALQEFGTRFHLSSQAIPAIEFIRDKWQEIINNSGRTDLKVELYQHVNTPQPSVIFTIEGNEEGTEYVIIGGHADSITYMSYIDSDSYAPGADDNASGIGTITEVLRVLVENGYKPKKTIQIMAFSAEEIGLVGSKEIAAKYKADNKDVKAYVQFDMTNYKGSAKDVYVSTDSYNSNDLNVYLVELMENYNTTGNHQFDYGYTICNYGCSDHASWAQNGFAAAFPFEASFSESNHNIHSVNDIYSVSGSSTHAAKFAKLALEFLVESTKPSATMGVSTSSLSKSKIAVTNKSLHFILDKNFNNNSIKIVDATGRLVYEGKNKLNEGNLDLQKLNAGFYVIVFNSSEGKTFSSKFILK